MTRRCMLQAVLAVLAGLLLSACGGQVPTPPLSPAAQATVDAATAVARIATPTLQPIAPPTTPTPKPEGYWVQPGVPESLVDKIAPVFQNAGLIPFDNPDGAIIRVVLNPDAEALLTMQLVYTVVAPFPTVPDGLSWNVLQGYWRSGDPTGLETFGTPPQLVLTPDSIDLLTTLIGPPAEGLPLQVASPDELVSLAWSLRPAISILPFDQLDPRWKVLALDGQSVLDRTLDVSAYPLVMQVGLETTNDRAQQVAAGLEVLGLWPATNRNPSRITIAVLTGVTAMARATAMEMEINGYDFPARAILPFFADADILHTSNEVAFAIDCPPPAWVGEPVFCSNRNYLQLLQLIGLDIVELTGNHINDWGTAALSYTLDVYDGNGIAYYGGGRNLEDAISPRILTAPDGTRFAFVGCNVPGPWKAFATAETPGAAPCDDWSTITSSIQTIKANGQADVVIATLQYWELPQYAPSEQQVTDFERLIAAGADIVSGSQAHQPQGFAFVNGRLIHYGVGNLFFDQMDYLENRQMFADKHVFYEGRHISTVLFTGLMEDYAQPQPMTAEDRAAFLQTIFEASGW